MDWSSSDNIPSPKERNTINRNKIQTKTKYVCYCCRAAGLTFLHRFYASFQCIGSEKLTELLSSGLMRRTCTRKRLWDWGNIINAAGRKKHRDLLCCLIRDYRHEALSFGQIGSYIHYRTEILATKNPNTFLDKREYQGCI